MTVTTRPVGRSDDARPESARRRDRLGLIIPALVAYVPLLLTAPGKVGADTKTYLYLDPGKLLRDAPYVWDSQIGLGTVTHQNIGYLWPMGPFYWVLDKVGAPDWVAQRLWLGTVVLAAGLGVRYLLRTLDWGRLFDRRGGVLVAVLAYMLSPYLLNFSARISVILLPWAALPWLIALTAKALRHGGWRYPALFALVVLTVGGINATALILVGIGPALWCVHAVWIDREVSLKQAIAAIARIGLLTFLTALWWMAGLWAEGRYGLPVIRYTETYKTVAEVSTAPEVLRGLGYWFFYGSDKLGPWIEPSVTYTTNVVALTVSYAVPLLAILAAALVRWRYRAFFLALTVLGALTAIGSHPWNDSSPLGAAFKAFTRTDAGLSLRSTPRAVPLVALGLSVLLGAGVSAVGRRLPRLALPVTGLVGLLVLANLPTLWSGQMVAKNLQRPEDVPQYWQDAAAYLGSGDPATRTFELPGIDFASYRWGNTVDPITPGLTTRQYVARELFTWGSAPSANLLNAIDRRFHEGDMVPDTVAPISRLLGAGDLTLRSDLQYERYRIARPRELWKLLNDSPGLAEPIGFGEPTPNVAGPEQPLRDEIELDTPPTMAWPPPVSVFGVQNPLPVIRAHAADHALLVAGDGEGLVDAASVGLLDPTRAAFYTGSLAGDQAAFDRIYGDGADLLVTDTNRRRARRWSTLRENDGYTERAGETPLRFDPTDQRLALFPDAGDDAYTVAEHRGGATVAATAYGNPISYTPSDRAVLAVDGDPQTAWRVAAADDPVGERLVLSLDQPLTTDHLGLLQPVNGPRNRWITRARLHFDDQPPVDIELGDESRTQPGQTITFPSRTFSHLEIEIVDTNVGKRPNYDGFSGVGLAEVTLPGVRVDEVLRPPTDLLDEAGASSIDHRLALLFTRLRSNPAEPVRTDTELAIERVVSLPTARSFRVAAEPRLSGSLADDAVDRLLGLPDASAGGVTATSDSRLAGALDHRASAAIDGDPSTSWQPEFGDQVGHTATYTTGAPITFDHLDLQVLADGRHSVPTQLSIVADGDSAHPVVVDVPAIDDQGTADTPTTVRVDLPPITASRIAFTIAGVREVTTTDWYSGGPITMPVGIAEWGVPGLRRVAVPATFDSGCRRDLLSVDGTPVPLRVTGSSADAIARTQLSVAPCGDDPAGIVDLAAGEHVFRTGIGRDLGIDLDRVAFTSDRGGVATPVGSPDATEAALGTAPTGPQVHIVDSTPVSYDLDVSGTDRPIWLSVGQSWNDGWTASVDGASLGTPQVIDGYGNGWYVDSGGRSTLRIHVEWAPQRIVWVALAVSGAAVLACLVLVVIGDRRRPSPVLADDPERPFDPRLDTGIGRPATAAGPRAALLGAVGVAVFAALSLPFGAWTLVAPLLGVAAWAAYRSPRGRSLLTLSALAAYGLAAAYIVTSQWRHDYRSDFNWPTQFERVHEIGLLAIFLLFADAIRDLLPKTRKSDP